MRKINNLTLPEMERVFQMRRGGSSFREIGKRLDRDHTAILRLVKEEENWKRGYSFWSLTAGQQARWVSGLREKRRKKGRERGWLKSEAIREHVLKSLIDDHKTPEMIAETLGESFPGVSLSTKAIYNYLKKARPELRAHLPEKGRPRRQRITHPRSRFRDGAPPKRSIRERPQSVQTKEEYGHYEADTVHSRRGGKGGVLTIRELSSRHRWYFLLPNLEAATVLPLLMVFFQRLQPHLRKTLTLDNGSEWAEAYHKLEKVLPGFRVYFCDPYKAYQRGSVEQANRELRRFFPKGTDFAEVTAEELQRIQSLINHWPMKCLKWKTAEFVFLEALKQAA